MTYSFDIAHDCPISYFLELLENHNLKLDSFVAYGPAGGNPYITVSGTPENIESLKQDLEIDDHNHQLELLKDGYIDRS